MAYGFNPATMFLPQEPALPQFLTPEEIQQQAIAERFNANRGGGFVPAMMGALDYMRTAMPAQAPTPRTVSGGSVIGLMPEQTNALLNRVNEANMLDQRMYEARQGEMRADSRAREGRILSAREAQARRQQELAIEKQKMEMVAKKEAEERARPKLTPITGTNFAYEQRPGPDGNPTVSVVPIGGEQIPAKQATAKMGWIPGADGTTATWGELQPGVTTKSLVTPDKPMSKDEEVKLIREGAKFYQNFGRIVDGKEVPISLKEASEISKKELIGEPFSLEGLVELKDQKYREVTKDDGSVVWEKVGPGDQIKPPKADEVNEQKKRDKAIAAIQKQFPKKAFEDITRSDALTYLRAALDPTEYPNDWLNALADGLGFDVDESAIPGYGGARFNLPSAPAATPASFDLKYNPATGTFE